MTGKEESKKKEIEEKDEGETQKDPESETQ